MAGAHYDLILHGGRVLDPAAGVDGIADVAIRSGRIAAVGDGLDRGGAERAVDVSGKLIVPGMIDTHAHVYEHVTGKFGLNPDLVGVRSASTTLVDQGGPSCMTIRGFRHYVAEPARGRVLCFISAYLVGGLEGHLYPELYGPGGVNVVRNVSVVEVAPAASSSTEMTSNRYSVSAVRPSSRISCSITKAVSNSVNSLVAARP